MNNLSVAVIAAIVAVLWAGSGSASEATQAQIEYLPVPRNIETHNVPPIPLQQARRLAQYSHTRSAYVYGWQGQQLLIGTRFANTTQLHRVSAPLGYRQQLTFLPEPLAGVAVPATGAKDQVIINWDVGGSEFDQLFLLDLNNGQSRMVSDGKSLYGQPLWSPDEQRFAYVTTQRNGRNWDTHIQDLDGHVVKVLETDDGFWHPLGWSADGTRLLIKNRVSINVASIHELDIATQKLTPLVGSGVNGSPTQMSVPLAAYDKDGGLYFTSDADSEFLRLHHLDRSTGDVRVLTPDVQWDVSSFTLSPQLDTLAYVVNNGGISELQMLSVPRHRKLKHATLPDGIVRNHVFAPDGKRLAVSITTTTSPTDVYVMEVGRRQLTRWTESEVGGLNKDDFVNAQRIEYVSFDGRKIPAFVFKPRTPGPHPVVIYIHGGPESQYRPYFSTLVQSFVNEMNVAVIAPNVRGSAGYGKSYLQLDNGMQREDSVKDIGALLDWIDNRTDFRSDRVAVYGGSYGGYMVLASMVHFGDRLAAAVDSVGISNFVSFLENTQAYRQDMRRVEYGDERDPRMRRFLENISPLNHVDKMRTPVLISQGANDPRVPASESAQIHQALQAQGETAWYVLAHDEGHGMRKKVNRDFDRAAKFSFLEHFLNQE